MLLANAASYLGLGVTFAILLGTNVSLQPLFNLFGPIWEWLVEIVFRIATLVVDSPK